MAHFLLPKDFADSINQIMGCFMKGLINNNPAMVHFGNPFWMKNPSVP
jgi:hypothetical protein